MNELENSQDKITSELHRAINELVAIHVMGWDMARFTDAIQFESHWLDKFETFGRRYTILEYQIDDLGIPDYSTDIEASWLVIEKLAVGGTLVQIAYDNEQWLIQIDGKSCSNTCAPLAICLAALQSVGCPMNL